MFINYKGTNVHAMPETSQASLTLNQSPQSVKWLQPGWNEFPKNVWDQNKENPGIKRMVKEGLIELLEETVSVRMRDKSGKVKTVKKTIGHDDKPVALKYFEESKAIKIVNQTFNRDILQRWADEETRHKVKRALEKQLKPLLSTKSDDEEG